MPEEGLGWSLTPLLFFICGRLGSSLTAPGNQGRSDLASGGKVFEVEVLNF
jgi:hypothetical protein